VRRRGYTPEAIRDFLERLSASKTPSTADMALLEACLRQDLNKRTPRRFGVLNPLKVVLTNWPEGRVEQMDAVNNPEDESAGTRPVPFTGELYIEREDFMEEPVKKFYRLAPGREVRLRWAYFITCRDVVKHPETGEITELRCTYDPATRGGDAPDGRRVKATLHWAPASHAIDAEVRMYDRLLFDEEEVDEEDPELLDLFNRDSRQVLEGCKLEPSLADATPGDRFQFERKGYFCMDPDSTPEKPVFNLTVTMRDRWKRILKRRRQQQG
jgi:glutaminyl-tRNA synthetase